VRGGALPRLPGRNDPMNRKTTIGVSVGVMALGAVTTVAAWQAGAFGPRAEQPNPGIVTPADPSDPGEPPPSIGAVPRGNGENVQMVCAVTPKELSPTVKKGLAWIVAQQHSNGGWGQGGGWRTGGEQGGRVEGAQVQDPPDVGNTCMALLALVRAGNTA